MFGKKKYNYKNPYGEKKQSTFKAIINSYIPKKETLEEKRSRLEEEYEGLKLEGRNLKAKNFVQREKNTFKKLSGSVPGGGGAPGVPDYLGLNSKPSKKSKDPLEDLGKFKI